MNLQQITDRIEIQDLLAAYCHAVDRGEREALTGIFAPGAMLDYTAFGGPSGPVEAVGPGLMEALGGFAGTQHLVTTIEIDLDGDRAAVRSAALVHVTPRSAQEGLLSGLWYEDEFVRTASGWRISARRQVRAWGSRP